MDKRSLSQPVFDGDVPAMVVENAVDSAEGHLNLSGDSAISATSVFSNNEQAVDIVSLCGFTLHFLISSLMQLKYLNKKLQILVKDDSLFAEFYTSVCAFHLTNFLVLLTCPKIERDTKLEY